MSHSVLNRPGLVRGENGTLQHTLSAVGDKLVGLFFSLVRDVSDNQLCLIFQQCLLAMLATSSNFLMRALTTREERDKSSVNCLDLFVLAFQTRDCRGGKGERLLFYKMFLLLALHYPQTTISLIPLIQEYGSWKDYFTLLEVIESTIHHSSNSTAFPTSVIDTAMSHLRLLEEEILKFVATSLREDFHKAQQALSAREQNPNKKIHVSLSLASKYAPREKGHFHTVHKQLFNQLLGLIFPDLIADKSKQRRQYRQLLSLCCGNEMLAVVESKMCAGQYAEIDFAKVPSRCLKKYTKAFLNEKMKGPHDKAFDETGDRFPDNEDRSQARKHLVETLVRQETEKNVKGGQVFPHELAAKYINSCYGRSDELSTMEELVIQCQWNDMRSTIEARIRQKLAEQQQCEGKTLDKLLPLVDVSGSMTGTPMEVAIALGILISELNHPAFRDRLITFSSNPSWVNLSNVSTLKEKVSITQRAPWGMTTDIEKAFALIEEVVRTHRLKEEDIPDLIIFSDMQFDAAAGRDYFLTQEERIRCRFHDLGMSLTGKPYQTPRIIFWNLRGNTTGYPAKADASNVQMLSGYSPSLFNALVDGLNTVEEEEDVSGGPAKKSKAAMTPLETVRRILDDKRYDAVREKISSTKPEKSISSMSSYIPYFGADSIVVKVSVVPSTSVATTLSPPVIVDEAPRYIIIGPKGCKRRLKGGGGRFEVYADEIDMKMSMKCKKRNDKKMKRTMKTMRKFYKESMNDDVAKHYARIV